MSELKVVMMPTEDLIPYENNPRRNDSAVDAVAASIREFGFKVPIIVDKENVIVTGHTRLKAAEQLGLAEVPVIRADDLSEEQINAFRLADNKTGELAGWDFAKLDLELAEIYNIDMEDFGFIDQNVDAVDIDDLFEESPEKEKEPKRIQCPHCGEWIEV